MQPLTIGRLLGVSVLSLMLTSGCGGTVSSTPPTLSVHGVFTTSVEEPWVAAVHAALLAAQQAGEITYAWDGAIGTTGSMEPVLRRVASQHPPDIFVGDAFGDEDAVRRVAADYPHIAFVFGSGLGPSAPNLSVFDDWIYEPAYLCGLLAGGLTVSHKIGVVGGLPVPEVNRLVNAFIAGAKEVNPQAQVLVTFINQWFNPAVAQSAAQKLVSGGADVIYAERDGAIEAAAAAGVWAFGNILDQRAVAPTAVVSSAVWNMTPMVEYVLLGVREGWYQGEDLREHSLLATGGAALAPFGAMESQLPAQLVEMVRQREQQIKSGMFRVVIDETSPPAAS
jgi:basic membrane protein A